VHSLGPFSQEGPINERGVEKEGKSIFLLRTSAIRHSYFVTPSPPTYISTYMLAHTASPTAIALFQEEKEQKNKKSGLRSRPEKGKKVKLRGPGKTKTAAVVAGVFQALSRPQVHLHPAVLLYL
jgi:hypothetical protein